MKEKLTRQSVGFAQIKNEVLNDKKLSWRAKGLFAYLYSKPDDWDFSADRIMLDSSDGRDSTRGGLKELEEAGYLTRKKRSDGKKDWYITYEPTTENQALENPTTEKPNDGKTQRRKIRRISNTESYTNKELVTNKDCVEEKTKKFIEEVKETLKDQSLNQKAVERIQEFVSYWTEPTKSKTKLRWELQPTWDMKRRLGTWMRNTVKFGQKGMQPAGKYKATMVGITK